MVAMVYGVDKEIKRRLLACPDSRAFHHLIRSTKVPNLADRSVLVTPNCEVLIISGGKRIQRRAKSERYDVAVTC